MKRLGARADYHTMLALRFPAGTALFRGAILVRIAGSDGQAHHRVGPRAARPASDHDRASRWPTCRAGDRLARAFAIVAGLRRLLTPSWS